MFLVRVHFLEATEWVRHTSDVELAVAACRLHVREAEVNPEGRPVPVAQALADVERIRWLTADNPKQELRATALVSPLQTFSGDAAAADRIDLALGELAAVESSLKDVRLVAFKRATRAGWLVSSASTALTFLVGAFVIWILVHQSRALVRVHASLKREAAMLESVVDSMVDGVMAITTSRAFLHINRAARRLLGADFPGESFPKDWRANIQCFYENGTEMKPEEGALARAITGKSTDNLVYRTRQTDNPDDPGTWISATARPVHDSDGAVIAGVVALRDITAQKHQQDQLRAMSMSDEMTGLHNRRGFLMLAEQHARVAQRHRISFAVVFADLNGLKKMNDLFGHEAGDRMIRATADVMRDTFRESDIVARLGGDEFVALLANATPAMQATIMARLRKGIAARNAREPPAQWLSLSIGMTFFEPERPLPLRELMVEADRLMYVDKRGHGRLLS